MFSAQGVSESSFQPSPIKQPTDAQAPILEALKKGKSWVCQKRITQAIQEISPEDLRAILEIYFTELVVLLDSQDPVAAARRLASILPFEELQKASCDDGKQALELAKAMLEQAKYYLKYSNNNCSPSLRTRISNTIDSLVTLMDNLVSAFGVSELLKPDENKWDSDRKFQKILMLLTLFSMLSAMLIPALGAQTAGLAIGGTLLFIAALSMIYPKIRPTPTYIPHAENLTKKFHQGGMPDLACSSGRQDVLDLMAQTLISSQTPGETVKHPLLIGKSGVGKSQAIEAFVQAIELGRYPALKGKKVFCINTPDLQDEGDFLSTDPLKQIEEAIGRHKGSLIFVLDEIHIACQGGHELLGERLKKRLDPNGDFPLIIGITTTEEFDQNISKNKAFTRRFLPITIDDTDEYVTGEILNRAFLTTGSSSLRERDALAQIYRKTAEKHLRQPLASREILKECIDLTSDRQRSELVLRIEKLKAERSSLCAHGASASLDFDRQEDVTGRLTQLEKAINELELQVRSEKEQLAHLFALKKKMPHVKKCAYQTVVKVGAAQTLSRKDEEQLKLFMLLGRFVSPTIEKYIQTQARARGVSAVIDEQMIDRVIASKELLAQRQATAVAQEQT